MNDLLDFDDMGDLVWLNKYQETLNLRYLQEDYRNYSVHYYAINWIIWKYSWKNISGMNANQLFSRFLVNLIISQKIVLSQAQPSVKLTGKHIHIFNQLQICKNKMSVL